MRFVCLIVTILLTSPSYSQNGGTYSAECKFRDHTLLSGTRVQGDSATLILDLDKKEGSLYGSQLIALQKVISVGTKDSPIRVTDRNVSISYEHPLYESVGTYVIEKTFKWVTHSVRNKAGKVEKQTGRCKTIRISDDLQPGSNERNVSKQTDSINRDDVSSQEVGERKIYRVMEKSIKELEGLPEVPVGGVMQYRMRGSFHTSNFIGSFCNLETVVVLQTSTTEVGNDWFTVICERASTK